MILRGLNGLYLYNMTKQNNQSSFLASEHRSINMPLFDRVNLIVDWKTIETEISKYYKKGQSIDCRLSYSPIIFFKMLLLQTGYGLSDESVELNVRDRISFSKFCCIATDEYVLDSRVLCRFTGALSKGNAFEKLLLIINQRQEDNNLMITT